MFCWLSVVAVFALLLCEPNVLQGAENEDPLGEEIGRLAERIKDLEDDVLEWSERNSHRHEIDVEQLSDDLVSGLYFSSLVDERFHNKLRRELSIHRKKLLILKRREPDLEGLDTRINEVEEAQRIDPLEGDYHVKIKGQPERVYRLRKQAERFTVTLVDSAGANTASSEGEIKWSVDDAEWKGHLDSEFDDDPAQEVRRGEILLVPLQAKVLVGEQTWHEWDAVTGQSRRKVMQSARWEWYRPLLEIGQGF